MTAIIGYSESLRDEHLSVNEKQQFVETIIRSGKHLLTIINDILDLSKIEAHKLEVEKLEIPLANLIRDLHAHISIKAEEKGLIFNISPILPLPSFFISDPTRIKQILFNLAGNAVKFTNSGTINILIRYEEESDTLYFEIKDTGIGLTSEQKNKVFEPFTQADDTTTRKYGGTGLGLYISKQLAELLEGEIYVDSQPGLGSEFVLAIHPGNLAEASWFRTQSSLKQEVELVNEYLERTDTIKLEGNILVAEDNLENQRLFKHLFEIMGLNVTMVDNGKKALEAAHSQTFDLALLDIQMPEMGGEEAAAILKQQQSELPLIALTANVMQHQIDNYLNIGFTDVIGKPFDRKHFYHTLKKYLPEKQLTIQGRGYLRLILFCIH
jgi:CheY-like chemotaxis protein